MTALRAIVVKELLVLVRDPAGLIMLFLLPAAFVITLSVALQGAFSSGREEDRLSVVVVDDDGGEVGRRLRRDISVSGLFRVARPRGGPTRAEALEGLRDGRYQVVVIVPRGATRALRFQGDATVEVVLDPVASAEVRGAAESVVRTIVSMAAIERLRDRAAESEGAWEERPRGLRVSSSYLRGVRAELRPNVVQQNVPGWTIFALFWIAQILALNILSERESGISTRILAAPVSTALYLAGKMIPFLVINLLQAVVMFAVGVLVLPLVGCPRLEVVGIPALLLVTVAISLASIAFGLLMASVSRSNVLVASVTAAILVIMAVVGGIMVPRFIMPHFVQQMGLFVPHGWALDAYLRILVRGCGVSEIVPHIAALLGFATVFFVGALARLRLGRS